MYLSSDYYSLTNLSPINSFFFFNDTATTEIYTLSLHDALPISCPSARRCIPEATPGRPISVATPLFHLDRKSTCLNSSHSQISYAVFCLKKKKKKKRSRFLVYSNNIRSSIAM